MLAAFPFNKFPVSKKIHKTQFLEVNNSETSEKETKTETSSVPNGHEEHAVVDACLLHVAPRAPRWGSVAHWFEPQNHHKLKEQSLLVLFQSHVLKPGPSSRGMGSAGQEAPALGPGAVSPALLC